jgi:hypothetical protein
MRMCLCCVHVDLQPRGKVRAMQEYVACLLGGFVVMRELTPLQTLSLPTAAGLTSCSARA